MILNEINCENGVKLVQFENGPMGNLQYAIIDLISQSMAVVDPAWNTDTFFSLSEKFEVSIDQIWVTHGHFDHVNQLDQLCQELKNKPEIYLSTNPLIVPKSSSCNYLNDGDQFRFGPIDIRTIYTPGHSPDSICFHFGNHLVCGDVLFINAIGRTDLPKSDPTAMTKSLHRLSLLDENTQIYPGHNYGPKLVDSIKNQLTTNPFLKRASSGYSGKSS